MKRSTLLGMLGLVVLSICLTGCFRNKPVNAGHVAYVYKKPYFLGKGGFSRCVKGPGKTGLAWNIHTIEVDVRPSTYSEDFRILMKDELNVSFRIQAKIQVKGDDESVKAVVERYGLKWYDRFIKEQFRSYVRDTVRAYTSREVKDRRDDIRALVLERMKTLVSETPFEVMDVVVGNIDFPEVVTKAVEQKLKADQDLERVQKEIEIEKLMAQKRIEEAKGIAEAQKIINASLTPQYLQYLGIQNMEKMADSPNTTVFGLPLGSNMVPIVNMPAAK